MLRTGVEVGGKGTLVILSTIKIKKKEKKNRCAVEGSRVYAERPGRRLLQ